jgi:hypothetical protein
LRESSSRLAALCADEESALLDPVFAVLLFAGFCWSARAQEAAVQPLLKEGDSAFAKGDYATARRSFEKALQLAQQLPAAAPARYEALKRLTSNSAASK